MRISVVDRDDVRKHEERLNTVKVIEALNSRDGNTRDEGLRALGRLRDPRAVEPLISYIQRTSDSKEKELASDALAWIGEPAVESILEALLSSSNTHIQRTFICTLGKIGDSRAASAIVAILNSQLKNPPINNVIYAAAKTLKELGNSAVAPIRTLLLSEAKAISPQDFHRFKYIETVCDILRFIASPEAVDALQDLLHWDDPQVVEMAAFALKGRAQDDIIDAALFKLLEANYMSSGIMERIADSKQFGPKAVPFLVRFLDRVALDERSVSFPTDQTREASLALAKIGTASAVTALRRFSEGSSLPTSKLNAISLSNVDLVAKFAKLALRELK